MNPPVSTANIPDAHRCRHEHKTRTGGTIECNDLGGWVLDTDRKTWRPARPGEKRRRCWLHGPGSVTKPIGRGGRRDAKPNERMQRFAALLLGLAPEVTKALHDVNDELSMLGFPSAGGGTSRPQTLDDGPVARDAIRIAELTELREQLRDLLVDHYLGDWLSDVIETVTRIRNRPPAAMGAKLCCDNQQDRAGSVEWGDPSCTKLPDRDGLCNGEWQKERRWRTANGLEINIAPVE